MSWLNDVDEQKRESDQRTAERAQYVERDVAAFDATVRHILLEVATRFDPSATWNVEVGLRQNQPFAVVWQWDVRRHDRAGFFVSAFYNTSPERLQSLRAWFWAPGHYTQSQVTSNLSEDGIREVTEGMLQKLLKPC